MEKTLIFLNPDSGLSLQAQIRQKLVEGITLGTFPPGRRLPSSRKLAEQLGVARNTVVLVYEQLVEEGYLVSRARSGIYVNKAVMDGRVDSPAATRIDRPGVSHWRQRFKASPAGREPYLFPPNWSLHPYPFLDGKFDASLFPVKEWREASRLALGVRDINAWSEETGDADDPMLIEEIRTKILPRRGIQAMPEEILVTVGSRQAMHLTVQLLVDSSSTVAVEDPGTPVMRQMLAQCGASVIYQPVDDDGLVIDAALEDAQLVYVTPSHQVPTSVTMSAARRESLLNRAEERNQLIIEDDTGFENNYIGKPLPALRGMDRQGRVIYISCLSKVLDTGLCVGFIVAEPEFIAQARKLRRLAVNHPPPNNQRAAAYFLSLGHYDSFMMHMHQRFGERWKALLEALSLYLLHFVESTPTQGGTSVWIQGPPEIEMSLLIKEAARRGILIEPVSHYYATPSRGDNYFRMGITSIEVDKIREGVQRLSELIHELTSDRFETLEHARGRRLTGDDLKQLFSGATIFWKTINGDPATIDYREDGLAEGRIGYANEDRGEGRWWVEDGLWYRQWERWYFGEPLGFHVVLDGSTIKLFEQDGQLSDIGVLHRPEESAD